MHSLESEYGELKAAGVIDAAGAERAVALEERALFSVSAELRLALYASVAAITGGIGIVLKHTLDRIGPVALSIALAVVAAGCYASAIRTRSRCETRSAAGDYVLLLGALVLSADLGYIESQFHWFGANWSWQLLLLALFHALGAYVFASRLLLSVALTSLASWFGVTANLGSVFDGEATVRRSGIHSLLCATVVWLVREAHRRVAARADFAEVYEHFAVNLAFWGAIALCFADGTRLAGFVVLVALGALATRRGLVASREILFVYGIGYTAFGCCVVGSILVHDLLLATMLDLLIVVAAVVLLWRSHRRLQAAPR